MKPPQDSVTAAGQPPAPSHRASWVSTWLEQLAARQTVEAAGNEQLKFVPSHRPEQVDSAPQDGRPGATASGKTVFR